MSTPDDSTPRPRSETSDDLDPELVNLRKTREGIGPVLALSVLALSGYVMLLLLPDLRYWAGDKAPRDLGPTTPAAGLTANTYVTIAATPARALASRLRARQDIGRRLVPVLGTNRGLWLELEGDGTAAVAAYDERYTGRLRELDDLGFRDELAARVAGLPPHARYLDPAKLGGPIDRDVAGDAVTIGPETPVELEERVLDRARVTVILTETLADEAKVRAALTAALGADPGEPAARADTHLDWDVAGEPAALRARLGDAKLFAASIEPVTRRYGGSWKELSATGDAVTLAGRTLPRAAIVRAGVLAPETLPPGALILVAGDVPQAYWYVPLVFGALALLSLLTLWAFVRTLLGEPPAKVAT